MYLINQVMEKILSKKQCKSLLERISNQEWERVDLHSHYHQSFVEDKELEKTFENYFGKKFLSKPIIKVLKLGEGDYLPNYTSDYDSITLDEYKKYHGTNFTIECYLNDNFIGGSLNNHVPRKGYGIIHNKTNICKVSKVTKGICYLIFCYIKDLKENKNLL